MIKKLKLGQSSKYTVQRLIDKSYGGQYTKRQSYRMANGTGIGGLKYVSGSQFLDRYHDERDTLSANFERLKEGLAIYFRNIGYNVAYFVNFEDIVHVRVTKEADILSPKKGGIFERLINWGVSYAYAKIMLLDESIIKEFPTKISLTLSDGEEIIFRLKRQSPWPIANFFDDLLTDSKEISIEDYVYQE